MYASYNEAYRLSLKKSDAFWSKAVEAKAHGMQLNFEKPEMKFVINEEVLNYMLARKMSIFLRNTYDDII